jgi:hypothetical protein
MRMLRTLSLTAGALVALGAAAAQAQAPDFHLAATPKLYVLSGSARVGGPTVYVAFRSRTHLHEPRLVVVAVHGEHGRTYASRGLGTNCYRSTLFYKTTTDDQSPRKVTVGRTYRVDFLTRANAHTSNETRATSARLVARSFTPRGLQAPAC